MSAKVCIALFMTVTRRGEALADERWDKENVLLLFRFKSKRHVGSISRGSTMYEYCTEQGG